MFIFATVADNISRRKAFMLSISISNLGMTILCLSQSMEMAVTGMFIIGLSAAPVIRIIEAIISETTEKTLKQKFLSSMTVTRSIAYILLATIYKAIGNWRYSMLYSGLLSGVIMSIAFYFLV